MFICLECGRVFDEDEIAIWQEDRGEYWGVPCSQMNGGCPSCQGDYVYTYRCRCCHKWIGGKYIKLDDDERICENCYTEYEIGEED